MGSTIKYIYNEYKLNEWRVSYESFYTTDLKLNTRKKIIETAYKVFSEKGFSVPSSIIAKEAGVSHGSIFAHFPTMNDLLISLLSDFGDKMGSSLHILKSFMLD